MACKPAQKIVKSMDIDEIAKHLRIDTAAPHYSEEELNKLGSKALRKFAKLTGIIKDEPTEDGTESVHGES